MIDKFSTIQLQLAGQENFEVGGGGNYYTEYGGTLKTVTVYWLVDFGSLDMAPTDSSDIMGSKSDICEKAIDFVVSFFSDYIRVECPY